MINFINPRYDSNNVAENIVGAKQARMPFHYGDDFLISYTPIRAGIFNIYLYGEIIDASQFVPAVEVLQQASENDMVVIHLSTPGGSLDATDTFIDAMRNCEAKVLVKATGGVHSAGTIILLNADEFTLSENSNFLIHNGSVGPGGKYSDWKVQAKHTEAYMERVMRSTYEGFLADEEIEALINGKDFMLDADQFIERWQKRNEYMKSRMESSQDEFFQNLIKSVEDQDNEPVKKVRKPRVKKVAQ